MGWPPCTAFADPLGRTVGASRFAFWTAIGQPRRLFRSSSGAKSRLVSHVPASSPTTLRPPCVRGSTATPPTAPMPTTTTSVSLSLVAMKLASLTVEVTRRHLAVIAWLTHASAGFGERVEIVRGLVIRPQAVCLESLLVGGRHHRAHAGVPDQIPPDEVHVPPVVGIAKHALAGVGQDHRKE